VEGPSTIVKAESNSHAALSKLDVDAAAVTAAEAVAIGG
jgi:hypothetical protein